METICAECGEAIEASGREVCPECGNPPQLDGRYRLVERLGHGAAGVTYRAIRLGDQRRVAIKQLSYQAMDSLETQELFEREARVLQQLHHPGIPEYLDDFSVESRDRLRLYLVQEYVDGETLEREQRERRYAEDDILDILEELADILAYLQARRPPVIHRDIKPTNVMRRADGRLVLIDFGSVKATTDGAVGGSTIAGTFGYMAPEQHWGRATPRTDVYGLGALGLALVSRRAPEEFVDPSSQRLAWRDDVQACGPFTELLGDMLESDLEDRLEGAEAAREAIWRTRERFGSESGQSAAAFGDSRSVGANPSEPSTTRNPEAESAEGTTTSGPSTKLDDPASRSPHSDEDRGYEPSVVGFLWFAVVLMSAFIICVTLLVDLDEKVDPRVVSSGSTSDHSEFRFQESACQPADCEILDETFVGSFTRETTTDQLAETFPSAEHTRAWMMELDGDRVDCEAEFRDETDRLAGVTCKGRESSRRASFIQEVRDKLEWLAGRYGRPEFRDLPVGDDWDANTGPDAVEGSWRWKEGLETLELSFEHDSSETMRGRIMQQASEKNPDDELLENVGKSQTANYVIEQRFRE